MYFFYVMFCEGDSNEEKKRSQKHFESHIQFFIEANY